MKTIKELAEEIGVSKVAVQKKINRLNIKNKMILDGNRWLVPEEMEKSIKMAFNKYDDDNQTDNNREDNENITQTLVSMLQRELEEKNKQIEKLQTIINQEQQLRMVTEQKLIAIEQKREEENENQEKKRGLFGWIFGSKPKDNDTHDQDNGTQTNGNDTTDQGQPNPTK